MRRQSAMAHSTSSQPINASTTMMPSAGGRAPTIEAVRAARAAARRRAPSTMRDVRGGDFGAAGDVFGHPEDPVRSQVERHREREADRRDRQEHHRHRRPRAASEATAIVRRVPSGSFQPFALSRLFSTNPPAAASMPTTRPWCRTLRRIVIETKRRMACRTGARPTQRSSDRLQPRFRSSRRGVAEAPPDRTGDTAARSSRPTRRGRDGRRRGLAASEAWLASPISQRSSPTNHAGGVHASHQAPDANAPAVPGSRAMSGKESTSTPIRTLLTAPENASSRARGANSTSSAVNGNHRQRREEAADQAARTRTPPRWREAIPSSSRPSS